MNREWSELNKEMQTGLKKAETLQEGKRTLFELRRQLMDTLCQLKDELSREEFNAIPFMNAGGYHSKTIAYSIWHIFRIEDIVAHTLIRNDEQIFFAGDYQKRTHAPIITTGNELVKQEIAEFSQELDLDELYSYAFAVKGDSEKMIQDLSYLNLKMKIPQDRKDALERLHVVSTDPEAIWLIDYWCGKDVRGLLQMPFSRHWIMHIEACLRIKNKIHP